MARPDPIDGQPVDLFEFLRLVAVASYRGQLTKKQAALATLVALDSDGTSGSGVVVQDKRIAIELDLSVSQVWRQFGHMRDAGWFEQTVKPARGSEPGHGRRSRYRTTVPPLDLGMPGLPAEVDADSKRLAESGVEARNDQAERDADSRLDMRDDPGPNVSHDSASQLRDDRPPTPETSRSSGLERLAVLDETSRSHHGQRCDSPTSDGPTSDGPTTPVVGLGAQPQDARATTSTEPDSHGQQETKPTDPEAERRRQLAALEALIAQEAAVAGSQTPATHEDPA